MQIRPIDPRTARWEVHHPAYRVYFWKRGDAPQGIPSEHLGHRASEYEVNDVSNVGEVLAWADGEATSEQTYTVYVVVDSRSDGLGVVRIHGTDPTRPSGENRMTR